jgi:hypothetical protein
MLNNRQFKNKKRMNEILNFWNFKKKDLRYFFFLILKKIKYIYLNKNIIHFLLAELEAYLDEIRAEREVFKESPFQEFFLYQVPW